MCFILEAVACEGFQNVEIILASDSHELVQSYNTDAILQLSHYSQMLYFNYHITHKSQLVALKAQLPGLYVAYINRKFNLEADRLA